MFDRTTNVYPTTVREIAKDVTINEHRAPTDESLKLLDEYRRKALDSILYSECNEGLKNNSLNYSMFVIDRPELMGVFGCRKQLICSITVNGKLYKLDKFLDELTEPGKIMQLFSKNQFDKTELIKLRLKCLGLLLAQAILEVKCDEPIWKFLEK